MDMDTDSEEENGNEGNNDEGNNDEGNDDEGNNDEGNNDLGNNNVNISVEDNKNGNNDSIQGNIDINSKEDRKEDSNEDINDINTIENNNFENDIKNNGNNDMICPCCFTPIDSQETCIIMECNHIVHQRCFDVLVNYKKLRRRLRKEDHGRPVSITCLYDGCEKLSRVHKCKSFNLYV